MNRMQKGFTLIELMIVVAIIGILAAVAIPQYQDYTVKAKLSKVMGVAQPIKTALALFNQENGAFPTTAAPWTTIGLSVAPSNTTEVGTIAWTGTTNVSKGTGMGPTAGTGLALTLRAIKAVGIDGGTVTMSPTTGSTDIQWINTCASPLTDAIALKYFNC